MSTGTKMLIIGLVLLSIVLMVAVIITIISDKFDTSDYSIMNYPVKNGDTLWGLATEYAKEGENLNCWIEAVKELNNCDSNIKVGQRIKIYVAK